MARYDIMPYEGEGADYPTVAQGRLNASETFLVGEPVFVNSDGELAQSSNNPTDATFAGIACVDGDTGNSGGKSFLRKRKGVFTDGTALQTGDLIPFWKCKSGTLLVSGNWSAAGTAFGDSAPTAANIGDDVSFALISGSWGFEVGQGSGADLGRIANVLTANGQSILEDTQGTGALVVVEIVSSQSNTLGDADAPA